MHWFRVGYIAVPSASAPEEGKGASLIYEASRAYSRHLNDKSFGTDKKYFVAASHWDRIVMELHASNRLQNPKAQFLK